TNSSTCSSTTTVTWEGESGAFFGTNGGIWGSEWAIWTNSSAFVAYELKPGAKVTVMARGTPAGGIYPRMKVLIDGVQYGDITVNGVTQSYTYTYNGTQGYRF